MDARSPIAAEAIRLNGGRIGFEGDFRAVRYLPVLGNGIEAGAGRFRVRQRGRATTKQDRFDQAARCPRSGGFNFPHIGLNEAVFVEGAAMNVGIKVAIGAFGRAEGPVDIDPELRVDAQRTAPTNFAKARARWESPS